MEKTKEVEEVMAKRKRYTQGIEDLERLVDSLDKVEKEKRRQEYLRELQAQKIYGTRKSEEKGGEKNEDTRQP